MNAVGYRSWDTEHFDRMKPLKMAVGSLRTAAQAADCGVMCNEIDDSAAGDCTVAQGCSSIGVAIVHMRAVEESMGFASTHKGLQDRWWRSRGRKDPDTHWPDYTPVDCTGEDVGSGSSSHRLAGCTVELASVAAELARSVVGYTGTAAAQGIALVLQRSLVAATHIPHYSYPAVAALAPLPVLDRGVDCTAAGLGIAASRTAPDILHFGPAAARTGCSGHSSLAVGAARPDSKTSWWSCSKTAPHSKRCAPGDTR